MKQAPRKPRQGTLALGPRSKSPEVGGPEYSQINLYLPVDAVSHKHLFLKLFHIYIFCVYGKWYTTLRILYYRS